MNVKSGSLAFRDLPIAGGKAALSRASTSNTNLLAKRKLGFTLGSGNDLWTSYLVKRVNTTNDNSAGRNAYGIAIEDNSYGDGARRFATLASQKWASNNPAYLKGLIDYDAGGNTNTNPTNSSSAVSTTYLVIGKFQDLGTNGATAKLWIARTSEVASIDQILTESALSAKVPNAFEGSAVLDSTRSASVTAGDFLYLYGFGGWSSKKRRFQVDYDEVRMGTDLPSVLGVPEPASLLMLVWGALALAPLARRCRRREPMHA